MKFDRETSCLFVRSDFDIFHRDQIAEIDCCEIEQLKVRIVLRSGREVFANNICAIDLLMQIKPSMLEGKRMKWAKHSWAFHNVIAHPLMQFFAFFKMYKLAFWYHDSTVPRPKIK